MRGKAETTIDRYDMPPIPTKNGENGTTSDKQTANTATEADTDSNMEGVCKAEVQGTYRIACRGGEGTAAGEMMNREG